MSLPPETSFWNKARTRIFSLVLMIVIPALAVLIYGAWYDLQQSLNDRKLESVRILHHAQSDFDHLLNDARRSFSDLIRVKEMRSPDNCTQVFTDLRFAYERIAPDAINMGLADPAGKIYCAINPVQGDTSLASQPDFQAALTTLDMAAGVYRVGDSSNLPMMNISYPVLSFNGEIQTVIFATFEVGWLQNWQNEVDLPTGAAVTLIAPDGSVLWRTISGEPVPVKGLHSSDAAWFSAAPIGTTVVEGADFDGVTRLNTLTPLQNSATLHLGYPVRELYAKAYENLRWKLVLMTVVIIAALILAWWNSERSFLRPLDKLLNMVKRLQGGDLATRVTALSGMTEINELGRSFNQMTDALQQRETERRQLEERFRAAFETSAIGMGLISLEGRILAANAAATEMIGYSEAELVQRTNQQNVYPEDAELGQDLHAEMMQGKRNFYSVEKRYVRKNGEVFWTQLTLSMVHDSLGKPDYLLWLLEDIDQRKRAVEELRKSEARFKAIYENAAIGISLIGPNGEVFAVNPVRLKLSGYSEAELFQLGGQSITYAEDLNVGDAEMQELQAGTRDSFQVEKRYIHKDGHIHWVRQSLSAVRDSNGTILYLVVIAEDIDERKRAIEELREFEARFKAIYENAAIGISLVGPKGNVIAVNPVLVKLSGYSEAELIQLGGQNITYSEDAAVGQPELQEILAGNRDWYQVEKRYVHKDGRIHWMRQSLSAVRDTEGNILYLVVIAEDIDERKRAIEELRESEARFKAMFENTAVGMAIMSLDRKIIGMNQASMRMMGYTLDELYGTNPMALSHPEDVEIGKAQYQEMVAGKSSGFEMEKRFVRKDGNVFWGRVTYSLVRDYAGQPDYMVGIIEDVTEERNINQKMAEAEREYRQALEQRITERTAELNLANERLQVKTAQDAVTAERTRLARDLHDAVTQTLFSTTLIADVLPQLWEMNQAEARRRLEELRLLTRGALAEMRTLLVELRPNALVEVPLPTLLRQLVESLLSRARINIQVSAEGERKLPADVQVGLYRIAQEALNNVVKHAGASEAVLTLRMEDTVRLTVVDNGKGFDPSGVTADHLGLKIMRERAESFGAHLIIYSEPDEGTQITVIWQDKLEP